MSPRVLYLHPHFTIPGGSGRHTLETGAELARRGWDIHIASIRNEPSITGRYTSLTLHTLGGELPSSLLFWLRFPHVVKQVFKLIDVLKPDILFSQVFPANWWGFFAKALKHPSIPHVWMCHEPSAFIHSRRWINALPLSPAGLAARALNVPLRMIDVRLSRHVDFAFGNSIFSRSLAESVYKYPEDRLGICYPGVDLDRFSPSATGNARSLQFVTCARLTKFKNIDRIIRALARLDLRETTLRVIGDGEELQSLRALVDSLNLSSRVTFHRAISDHELVEQLRSSVALIHAAEDEPFGLAPLEAMACGTPVIAIAGAGPAETVLHEETGFLCVSATEDELAKAMNWILEKRETQACMRDTCRNRAELYSWKQAADSLETAFQNLLHLMKSAA